MSRFGVRKSYRRLVTIRERERERGETDGNPCATDVTPFFDAANMKDSLLSTLGKLSLV